MPLLLGVPFFDINKIPPHRRGFPKKKRKKNLGNIVSYQTRLHTTTKYNKIGLTSITFRMKFKEQRIVVDPIEFLAMLFAYIPNKLLNF